MFGGGGIFRDECPGLGLRSEPFLVSKVAVSFARRIPARSQADVRYNAAISSGGGGGRLAVRTRSHARVMQSPQFMQETSHQLLTIITSTAAVSSAHDNDHISMRFTSPFLTRAARRTTSLYVRRLMIDAPPSWLSAGKVRITETRT